MKQKENFLYFKEHSSGGSNMNLLIREVQNAYTELIKNVNGLYDLYYGGIMDYTDIAEPCARGLKEMNDGIEEFSKDFHKKLNRKKTTQSTREKSAKLLGIKISDHVKNLPKIILKPYFGVDWMQKAIDELLKIEKVKTSRSFSFWGSKNKLKISELDNLIKVLLKYSKSIKDVRTKIKWRNMSVLEIDTLTLAGIQEYVVIYIANVIRGIKFEITDYDQKVIKDSDIGEGNLKDIIPTKSQLRKYGLRKLQPELEKYKTELQNCQDPQRLKDLKRIINELEQEIIERESLLSPPNVSDQVTIFPTDGILTPEHVEQTFLLNCYFMSTLVSLAKSSPNDIKNCFVDFRKENFETKPNVRIRLFKLDIKSKKDKNFTTYVVRPTSPIIITVEKSKIIMGSSQLAYLWPNLMEKALVKYMETLNLDALSKFTGEFLGGMLIKAFIALVNPVQFIHSRLVYTYIMAAITGRSAKVKYIGKANSAESLAVKSKSIYDTIKKKLSKSLALTAVSVKPFNHTDTLTRKTTEYSSYSFKGFDIGHAWAIVGTKESEGEKYITIQDALKGSVGKSYYVELEEFIKCFKQITVARSEVK